MRYYGLFSNGNKKLGKDTIIFNMCSARDCPSKRLGLCQLTNPGQCYALKSERMYPTVLPYRNRQRDMWQGSIMRMIDDIRAILRKRPDIKYFRFNESGDFESQRDVDRLKVLANVFPELQFYGYTARKDLSFRRMPKNLTINGSNWRRGKMNKFVALPKPTGNHYVCPGDCRACNVCKTAKSLTIEIILH